MFNCCAAPATVTASETIVQMSLKLPAREQFWMNIPPPSGWNIYSNFSDKSQKSLEDAVSKLVGVYPLLAGKLVRRQPEGPEVGDASFLCPAQGTIVEVLPAMQPLKELFRVVDNTDVKATALFAALDITSPSPEKWEAAEKAAREELEPTIQKYGLPPPVADETKPLFQVVIGKLPGNRAWVLIEVAHVIADGASFYSIHEGLNNIIQGKEPPAMEFKVAEERVGAAPHKSDQDKFRTLMGWLGTMMEGLPNRKQAITTLTARQDILATVKSELTKTSDAPFLSTNDILMASLAEAYKHHEVMCMLTNMRSRDASAKYNSFGNYERTVMFPTASLLPPSSNAGFIRKEILGAKQPLYDYYGTNEFPDLSKDLFGSVTSWTSLTKLIHPTGAKLELHQPNSAFLTGMGLDFWIIWNPVPGVTSIMTNMCQDKLAENAKTSTLFGKIFNV